MDLVSCDNCGVVIDADKLIFTDGWDDEKECYGDNAGYIDGKYAVITPCPVCEESIHKTNN